MKISRIQVPKELTPPTLLPKWCGHYTEITYYPDITSKVIRFFWLGWIWKVVYSQKVRNDRHQTS